MVISDVNQITYNGNGSQTAWPFTFEFIDADDIKLQLIDADGARHDLTSDYYVDTVNKTVYYPGYALGSEPPEEEQPPKVQTGQKLRVYRKLPVNQLASLGDKWPFTVIEKGLDKLTMLIQDVWGWISSNIMQLSDTEFTWDAKGYRIKNVGGPAIVNDAATKDYVDKILSGMIISGDGRTVPFDNVAQLRDADLVAGKIAATLGYYDINDGGAGVYSIRAAVPGDTDDGGSIIILENGNVAELICNGSVNVKQFGAIGDGVSDDTSYVQAAVNAAGTLKVDVVVPNNVVWDYTGITYINDIAVFDNSGYSIDTDNFAAQKSIILKTSTPDQKNANGLIIKGDHHPWIGVDYIGSGTPRSSLTFRHNGRNYSAITLNTGTINDTEYKFMDFRNILGGNLTSYLQIYGAPANNEMGFKGTASIGVDYQFHSSFTDSSSFYRYRCASGYNFIHQYLIGGTEAWRITYDTDKIIFDNRIQGKQITLLDDGTIKTTAYTCAGDPNSLSIVPRYLGEEILDTTNNTWYKCAVLSATGWKAITS